LDREESATGCWRSVNAFGTPMDGGFLRSGHHFVMAGTAAKLMAQQALDQKLQLVVLGM
jgi:hypothetical protein